MKIFLGYNILVASLKSSAIVASEKLYVKIIFTRKKY